MRYSEQIQQTENQSPFINHYERHANRNIMSQEIGCEEITENLLMEPFISSKNKRENSEKEIEVQIQESGNGIIFYIDQMAQLTGQAKDQLKKYQKKIDGDDQYNKNLRMKSLTLIFVFLRIILFNWTLIFIVDINENQTSGKKENFAYSQYETCPLSESKQFSVFNKKFFSTIFILIEAMGLLLLSNLFGDYFHLTFAKRSIIMIGLQIISLVSFLLLQITSSFGFIGIELISVLFKIVSINIFFITIILCTKLRIQNKKEFFLRFRRLNSLYALFFIFILKSIFFRTGNDMIQISALSFLIFFIAIIFQYSKFMLNFWKIQRGYTFQINDIIIEMESGIKFTLRNFEALCFSYFWDCGNVIISLDDDGIVNLVPYFYLAAGLLVFGLIFLDVLTKKTVIIYRKKQKYIYLVSKSLLSPKKPLGGNENQPISIGSCYTCLSQPARFYYEQCGHLYCGNNCVLNCLEKRINQCPICQKKSQYLIEIMKAQDIDGDNRKFVIINKYLSPQIFFDLDLIWLQI